MRILNCVRYRNSDEINYVPNGNVLYNEINNMLKSLNVDVNININDVRNDLCPFIIKYIERMNINISADASQLFDSIMELYDLYLMKDTDYIPVTFKGVLSVYNSAFFDVNDIYDDNFIYDFLKHVLSLHISNIVSESLDFNPNIIINKICKVTIQYLNNDTFGIIIMPT